MPKVFLFATFVILIGLALRYIILPMFFTKKELGLEDNSTESNAQPTLRDKSQHINEEVSNLKQELTQLEHEAEAEKRKAEQTLRETDDIQDDVAKKKQQINKL